MGIALVILLLRRRVRGWKPLQAEEKWEFLLRGMRSVLEGGLHLTHIGLKFF